MLQELDSQLGVRLPEDYRRFLLANNGGIPKYEMFTMNIGSEERECWVDDFIVVSEDLAQPDSAPPANTLSFWLARLNEYIPSDTLPIGVVCRDDILLLMLSEPHKGEVHLLCADEIPVHREPTVEDAKKATHFIAPSFSKFFESLYEDR